MTVAQGLIDKSEKLRKTPGGKATVSRVKYKPIIRVKLIIVLYFKKIQIKQGLQLNLSFFSTL
ncbi:hypothetical protein ASF12_01015 [Paenibacillus sp. Leaf72]|nr:hypothetical protein ASF12_01015 [Paenibacillus sp. Leaf72]